MALHPRRATREEFQEQERLARTGLIGGGLTDYFVWRMQEEWRDKEDAKPIRLETNLEPALNKSAWQIVDAICKSLGFSTKGQRNAKAKKIAEHLLDPAQLQKTVSKLPIEMRLALKRVNDAGGWMRFSELAREFGDEEGDAWFWNENPPDSLIGQLRVHGLLFVGRAKVGKVKAQVAVIPVDLIEPLATILAQDAAELDALGDYALARSLNAIRKHYDEPEYQPVIPREWLEQFVRGAKDPSAEWANLEHFDYFLSHSLIARLEDITARQLGVWVTTFLQTRYLGEFPMAEKRAMLKSVAAFYKFLSHEGLMEPAVAARVAEVVDELVRQKKQIEPEELPPPLGGEVVIEGQLGDRREVFTYNDRWLTAVCAAFFHGDWDALYAAAARVPDGKKKQQHIRRIASFDEDLWRALTQNLSKDEAAFARTWFDESKVIDASAW